ERHLAIFVNYFCLERTNQLSLLPDKDLVDLCSPIEPYQVTKSRFLLKLTPMTAGGQNVIYLLSRWVR
ncbi:hypothetical protein, partial [Microcystis sp. LEGE 08355]|uniref:hypothetical protein n=1 Tax=Microcystis sp. LEGE 08355 TaxID=1828687 RepID=UPI001D143C00